MKKNLAQEVEDLKLSETIFEYDYHMYNPKNSDTTGVRVKRL
jgi:hypothetical protein